MTITIIIRRRIMMRMVVVVVMMMMMMMIIIIIIIIIKIIIIKIIKNLKYIYSNNHIQRHIRDFFTISSLRREVSPTRILKWTGRIHVQITCNTSSAYHVRHVVLRAMWYEGTAQLLYLTEFEIAFV